MSEEMDDRFSQVITDPRFRTLRKSDKKVKVDKRFQKMFTDKKFKMKSSVDKRGKLNNDDKSEDYKKFYNLSEEEKSDEPEDDKSDEESEKQIDLKVVKPVRVPNARGLDSDEQSFSSSSESEDSCDESEDLEHKWNEWDRDVPKTESATKRLAVCNLDWDRINANDLFVLINSFKPSGGSILSVKIIPSELGLQRMKAEAESGPIQFINTNKLKNKNNPKDDTIDANDDEERPTDDPRLIEELRQYEMTKLKYFYAVVECDNDVTAEVLYNELDGMEYESSSTALDLRFIPEDMTFDVEPKSECYSMPDLSSYKAPQFINSALQQSKVKLTWDQTDPKRKDAFEKAFSKEGEDDNLKAYLATSDEDDDDEEDEEEVLQEFDSNNATELKTNDKINKYKNLLNSLTETKKHKNEDNLEMEISWEPNLKDLAEDMVNKREQQKDISTFEQNFIKKKEKRKQTKNVEKSDDSDIESDSDQLIDTKQKHKEKYKKKKQKSEERSDPNLELLFMDSSDETKKHFNYKNIVENELNSKKNKQKSDDSFKFNADDPRFGAVYTSHHYNVDPSDPHYKRTEAFEEIMNRTKKKIKSNDLQNDCQTTNKSSNSWSQLVRNVKNKSQSIQSRNRNNFKIKQNKFKN